MPENEILNPPIQYNIIWLIIGLCIFALIPIWYLVVRWLTRRRPYKAYQNFSKLPEGKELELLKKKYLERIDEIYRLYAAKAITLRDLHYELSITLRYFVYEAKRVPAPIMTLSDLKVTSYPVLTQLVEYYYAEEFGVVGRGNATTSVQHAKGFITQWV